MANPPTATADVVLRNVADLLECPLWDDRTGRVVFVDCLGARALDVDPTDPTTLTERFADPGCDGTIVGFAGLADDGGLVVGSTGGVFQVNADGAVTQLASPPPGAPDDVRFNDGRVDAQGRLWAGTTTSDRRPGGGLLARMEPGDGDGDAWQWHPVIPGAALSNGLDWTADGRTLYYADSMATLITRYELDDAGRNVVDSKPFVSYDLPIGPDGLVVDADEHVWVAVWGAGEIRRYDPAGELDRVVEVPTANVTSCCFGGADLDLLFITSEGAVEGQSATDHPQGGSLFVAEPGVRGRPSHRFASALR